MAGQRIGAVALYVAFYNFCRPHETLTPNAKHQTTPAMALGLTDHVWSFGELIDAALSAVPPNRMAGLLPVSSGNVAVGSRRHRSIVD
jgi:hypothetical protein